MSVWAQTIWSATDAWCESRDEAFSDQINKLKFGYEYQGEHEVKNIAEPVIVYKVLTAPEHAGQLIGRPKAPKLQSKNPYIAIFAVFLILAISAIWHFYHRDFRIEPALVENMSYPRPDKPSIAVLPFDNRARRKVHQFINKGPIPIGIGL